LDESIQAHMKNTNETIPALTRDSLWYKDAIIYELHIRAYNDSDGDGMGDFRGLAEKLDYLQDLGVTTLWLLPFYPSSWKDDGYDISDYMQVHPAYGTLSDFKLFLREAHRRGLRVITELVLNHTSDQHAWFQRARRAPPGSVWRDFYVWGDSPEKYREARVIFKDFESSNWTWDPVAKAYYWHRFYSHQPDLNFDNPEVKKAMFKVVDFWLGMGVDGLRLDAVPYLYEREGTNCENLPETYAFLKELRRHVDQKFRDRLLLAEANQWPEDAVAYFGEGDQCHMAFHFPLMPRMFMGVRMEDRYPIIDILEQTPAIPENSQWALFLRNHDELTLEMVTDEERDYMYRVYAHDPRARINLGIRRRLAPLLEKDRKKFELMNCLLFSLPGTPVIYYGDEIGMGDNIYLGDRNSVRTPMQWSADRNAGFSRANPQQLYLPIIIDPDYHYEVVNVEVSQNNLHSALWFMKRLISLRKRFQAFGRGTLEFLYPENHKVLAFIRRFREEVILIVANLSRFAQYAELDLSAFKGRVPVELFGQTEFPSVGDPSYLVTLGPHAFYWFALEPQRVTGIQLTTPTQVAEEPIAVAGEWESVFRGRAKDRLEEILPAYMQLHRWFGAKDRHINSVEILDAVPVPCESCTAYVTLVEVGFTEGDPGVYLLPLAIASGEQADKVRKFFPGAVIAYLAGKDQDEARGTGILYEALWEKSFCQGLLEAITRRRRLKGIAGEIFSWPTRTFHQLYGQLDNSLEPSLVKAEQRNTSLIYGDRFILKIFRRLADGVNPDLEMGSFLTEKVFFPHIPHLAGAIEYHRKNGESMTLAILQRLVQNEGDAWRFTLDALGRYFERCMVRLHQTPEEPLPHSRLLEMADKEILSLVHEMIGSYLEAARLLGERTAELHLALASDLGDPSFAPEPFSALYQRSIYQSMRNMTGQVFEVLRKRAKDLPELERQAAMRLLDLKGKIFSRFQSILGRKITAMRMRIHGDYHLGQVLYTGKDFVIIDFEGDPTRPMSERRIKRSALQDVAGMIRSFHYAVYVAHIDQVGRGVVSSEDLSSLEPWARLWNLWVSSAFLKAYLAVASQGSFLPRAREELQVLLDTYLLGKAVYQLGYELNNRPDWVRIPLKGILQLVEAENG
jgi:maltose alpha-D-glucosyltransferase / alpha-amylase